MRKLYRSLSVRPLILLTPLPIFLLLILSTRLGWMYCCTVALAVGAAAVLLYRPDLRKKMCVQGVFFLLLCLFYYGSMLFFFPEYVGPKSSSLLTIARPGELLLVVATGMYWSGLFNVCSRPTA
jgi:hypothetical protein